MLNRSRTEYQDTQQAHMAVRRYFSPVAEIRAEIRKQDAVTIWIWFPLQPSHKIVESADEIVENTMVTGS